MSVDLRQSDTDRSHRVEQFKSGQRALLVKFTNYRAQQKLFSARKNLRNSDKLQDVFINEDLTSRRSQLLSEAPKLFVKGG